MTDPVKIIVGEGDITEVQVPEYSIIQTGGGGGGGGSDGATFFPEVSQEGVISWTNDGGYDNPEPVNIKGPAGNDGSDGEDGEDGQNGVTFTPSVSDAGIISWTNDGDLPNPSPVNIKGANGNDGEDGADGVSPTVTFTDITGGHTMTVTDKDHPSGQSINIMDGESGGSASMTILSYGNSTWNDFITAYNSNSIVYCRASSAADPSSGSQTRLAFMAYVNDSTNPTSVEFQYYRSVSSHTDSQQGDQVYIYKLTSAGVWSVTVREAYTKIAAGTNMTSSYADGTLTLNATGGGTADALPLAGGTMSGDINMDGNKVSGLPSPTHYLDAANKNYVDTRYIKPASGIPKSDLASAVQTSLGLADSALQSVPSTYRTAAAQDAIDTAQNGNLATIESSPATAAHAVGEYIVYNGQLYKVTAAIASGQTLTPGTNISAVSGGGLNDLKRISNYNPALIASGVTSLGRSLMSVYGEFFFFRAIIQVSTAQAQNAELFQLPSYNYDTTTTSNVLASRVDGGNGYTTVDIANKKIVVSLSTGMATGRYEIILFGKCT